MDTKTVHAVNAEGSGAQPSQLGLKGFEFATARLRSGRCWQDSTIRTILASTHSS
ncbi:hypothetical protein N8537_00265 [Synechococcus sp. AH-601-J22]|nr:hypothetical protein [Synechococcus sp. AH-601-J22]